MISSFQLLITILLLLHSDVKALLKKPIKTTFKLSQKPFEQDICTTDHTEITYQPVNNVIFRITSSLLAVSSFAVFSLPSEVFAAAGILVENGPTPVRRIRNVPADLSASDKLESVSKTASRASRAGALLPDTSVNALDGAVNLGAILFTFVLYNGFFGRAGKPSEWVLPFTARQPDKKNELWYKDFSDGFVYTVPPEIELLRISGFAVLGWFTNLAWIAALDGDSFWGWSTAACLAFPTGLIALSRDPKQTREEFEFDEKMKSNWNLFAPKILSKEVQSKCSESNIILRFRRSFSEYRTEEDVSDKIVKKMIRQWVGFKPNPEGYYIGVSLLNRKREARQKLAKTMLRLNNEKEANALLAVEDDDDDDDEGRFENEFIRRNVIRE